MFRDEPMPLTSGEFAVLKALVSHPREPLSRDKLMNTARGREYSAMERSIDLAPAPHGGRRSGASALYPDRLGSRLRVRPGRQQGMRRLRFSPRSSFARTLLLIVTLLFVSPVTTYLVVLNSPSCPACSSSTRYWRTKCVC